MPFFERQFFTQMTGSHSELGFPVIRPNELLTFSFRQTLEAPLKQFSA